MKAEIAEGSSQTGNKIFMGDLDQLGFIIETVLHPDPSDVWGERPVLDTSIALDSNDYPHIGYYVCWGTSFEYLYVCYDGFSWIFRSLDYVWGGPRGISLCLDSNDFPHFSYTECDPMADVSCIKYASFDGSSWFTKIVHSDTDYKNHGRFREPSISIDSQGNPHVSYMHMEGTNKTLKYAYDNGGGSWVKQTIDGWGVEGSQSMVLDSHDNPHIAYSKGESLKYAYYDGSSWNIETVDSNGVHCVSIALDSQNKPHISYAHGAQVKGLKYAHFDGESWNIQTVPDTIEDDVYDNSIALDSEGNPHISYYNGSALGYAYYNRMSWSVKIVDSGGVGSRNSIALDSRGYPHFSYVGYAYARSGQKFPKLRYAYAYPLPSLTVDPIFYDNTGTALVQPSSWSIKFPNDTIRTVSSPVTYNIVPAGNYSIVSIIWKETEVVPETTPTTSLTFDMVWSPSINCLLPTSLSTSLSSSTSYVGFKVEINGNLTCNEVGLSGAPVLLSYSVTGGESWNDITLVDTLSDGSYSAAWMPSATGNYLVRATWAGNFTYPRTNTTISLAVTPFKEQNVFSVTSNSTVSELAFNSTSRELSFTVTGPSGTTGYVNVHIAKTVVDNIADVKVYLDGDQINYTITSLDDSWLLHFTYHHSTRTIAISLGLAPFIPPQLTTPLSLGILAVALAVATAILVFRVRRGTPPTILNGVFKKSKQA